MGASTSWWYTREAHTYHYNNPNSKYPTTGQPGRVPHSPPWGHPPSLTPQHTPTQTSDLQQLLSILSMICSDRLFFIFYGGVARYPGSVFCVGIFKRNTLLFFGGSAARRTSCKGAVWILFVGCKEHANGIRGESGSGTS